MNLQQLAECRLTCVVLDFDRLGMIRSAGADGPVIGSLRRSSRIAGKHGLHAAQFLEHGFDTPETASGENGGLLCRRGCEWCVYFRIGKISDGNSTCVHYSFGLS